MNSVEYILDLLDTEGFKEYLGEPVSQREHALHAFALHNASHREHLAHALTLAGDHRARRQRIGVSSHTTSHAGMSVNRAVYGVLTEILEEEPAWSG